MRGSAEREGGFPSKLRPETCTGLNPGPCDGDFTLTVSLQGQEDEVVLEQGGRARDWGPPQRRETWAQTDGENRVGPEAGTGAVLP